MIYILLYIVIGWRLRSYDDDLSSVYVYIILLILGFKYNDYAYKVKKILIMEKVPQQQNNTNSKNNNNNNNNNDNNNYYYYI